LLAAQRTSCDLAQEVIGHLAHDIDVLRGSRLLKFYAGGILWQLKAHDAALLRSGGVTHALAETFRWRSVSPTPPVYWGRIFVWSHPSERFGRRTPAQAEATVG